MSFLSTLKAEELRVLREVTKRMYMSYWHRDTVTDHQIDKLIEHLGPQVAEKMIRSGVDKGLRD